jgi:nicotinamidase-related amidase
MYEELSVLMKIISVDFQNDFAVEGGRWYLPRPAVNFLLSDLIPELRSTGHKIAEIVSDYRLPRPSETEAYCVPGQKGYQSQIPEDIRHPKRWIKAMNSPVWTRENAGVPDKPAGPPYVAAEAFSDWLSDTIGPAETGIEVTLIGLTLDCCVLSTAQELYYRGYRTFFLEEAVDTYNGTKEEKDFLFKTPLSMWGRPINWNNLLEKLSD